MAYTKDELGPAPWFVGVRKSRWVEKRRHRDRTLAPPAIRSALRLEISGRILRAVGVEADDRFAVSVPKPGFLLLQRLPRRKGGEDEQEQG